MEKFPRHWDMFTNEGNAAVTEMMQKIKNSLREKPLPEVRKLLHQGIEEVSEKHGEVYDSDVREIIVTRLTKWACQTHEIDPRSALELNYWKL